MKNNKWYIAAAVVVVILGFIFYQKPQTDSTADDTNTGDQADEISSPNTNGNNENNEEPSETGSFWEGTLRQSNNAAKGNLMLQTADRVIYIKTSRDFSALVGKQVKVTYEGTLESFVMGDIMER